MPRKKTDDLADLSALSRSASATRTRNVARADPDTAVRKRKPIARKSVVLSVSLSPDDARFVREAAASHGMPVSVYVRFACHEYERHNSTVQTQ